MPKQQSAIPPRFAHQNTSVKFFDVNTSGLDASDPGTGKTRVQIESYAKRKARGCALVIAPKSILDAAWAEDFKKFAPNIVVQVCRADDREEAFNTPAEVYVTNTDAVRWLVKKPPSFFKKFDTLIIDELSAFKHHTSQRSRALAKISKHFKYRRGMTGTPNSNTIADIWHQIFVLDGGKRLGRSFYQFRAAVCTPTQVGPSVEMVKWEDKPGAELAVSGLLQDFVIRHKFEECLDIPKNHEYSLPYYLSKKQMAVYKKLERESIIEIVKKDYVVSAVSASAVMTKLLQVASGAVYASNEHYSNVANDRYEMVCDLVEERDHSVVFFNWTHQRDNIAAELTKRGISFALIDGSVSDKARAEAVSYFQKGLYQTMLLHPASAAHGITLTKGRSTIWASPTYNLEHWIQGNHRVYRAGQTKKTETISIIAPGTIEEKVYEKLMDKNVKQESLLSALKDLAREA